MTEAARQALDALDPRQRKAAIKHASGASITEAMRFADYSEKYINTTGPSQLQGNARFCAAVQAIAAKPLAKAVASADRTIAAFARMGYKQHALTEITPHHSLRALDRLGRIQKLFEKETVAPTATGTVINIAIVTAAVDIAGNIASLIPEVGGNGHNPNGTNGKAK